MEQRKICHKYQESHAATVLYILYRDLGLQAAANIAAPMICLHQRKGSSMKRLRTRETSSRKKVEYSVRSAAQSNIFSMVRQNEAFHILNHIKFRKKYCAEWFQ